MPAIQADRHVGSMKSDGVQRPGSSTGESTFALQIANERQHSPSYCSKAKDCFLVLKWHESNFLIRFFTLIPLMDCTHRTASAGLPPSIRSQWPPLVPCINHSLPIMIFKCAQISMLLEVLLTSTPQSHVLVVPLNSSKLIVIPPKSPLQNAFKHTTSCH